MLCSSISESELKSRDWVNWIAEPKKDGTRILAIFDGSNLILINRRNENKTKSYPEVAENLKISLKKYIDFYGNDAKTITLDCELCCKDFSTLLSREHLKDSFKIKLMSKKYPAVLYAFDILCLNGSLKNIELIKRKAILDSFADYQNDFFKILPFYENLDEALKNCKNEEGIILKDKNSKYEFDVRSFNWLKYKKRVERVIKFHKYEENKDGSLTLTNDFHRVKCDIPSIKHRIDKAGFIVGEVEGLEFTAENHIRFPILKRVLNG